MTHGARTRPRLPLSLICLLALSFVYELAVAEAALAVVSRAEDALSLVLDPTTGERHLDSLAPGETMQVHAVVDQLSALTLNAFQIGLEADASLQPIQVVMHPTEGLSLKPTLVDVYVGLTSHLLAHEGPHVLATWTFVRLPGFAADHPATVRMRDLENGEPSQYRGPAPAYHRAVFRDGGPVSVGNVAPSVVRFLPTTLDQVLDREYEVEWETHGLSDLALDGEAVDPAGRRAYVATATRDHVLTWMEGSTPGEQRFSSEVFVEPYFEILRNYPPPEQNPDLFPVHWVVRGAQAVWWGPASELVSTRGERGFSASGPASVTLRAENEWGTVTRSLVLRPGGDPVIASFWAEPTVIDRGDESLLTWSVVDAEHVTLEPLGIEVAADGSFSVTPDSTTTYTLRAERDGVQTVATCTVEVVQIRVERFGVDQWVIYPNHPVVLEWELVNAETAWIEPDVGPVNPVSGSVTAYPPHASTEFTLYGANERGQVTAQLTTAWKPPVTRIHMIDSTPREFMTWSTFAEGADSVRVDPGGHWILPPNGWNEIELPGGETITVRITAFNAAGSSEDELRYQPGRPMIEINPQASPQFLGGQSSCEVVVYRSTRLEITANGILPEPRVFLEGGTRKSLGFDFWLDARVEFRVTAENYVYQAANARMVSFASLHMLTVSVDSTEIQRGNSTVLRWQPSGQQSSDVLIEPLGITVPSTGSLEISPESTTLYRLICTYQGKPYRTLAKVVVVDGGTSLSAEPMRPFAGEPFELQLTMPEDALSARIEPGIGDIQPGTQTIEQVVDHPQEYLLEVMTPRGMESARVLVEPEGLDVVSTLVKELTFTAQARGPRVHLQWNVETAYPARSIFVMKGSNEANLSPWMELTDTSGEVVDVDARSGETYSYRLRLEFDQEVHESEIVTVRTELRVRTILLPNVPNPFNPATEIRWDLAAEGPARLDIFDLRGRLVRAVDLGFTRAGSGSWTWHGLDDQGDPTASGAYLVRLSSEGSAVTRKIVLVR